MFLMFGFGLKNRLENDIFAFAMICSAMCHVSLPHSIADDPPRIAIVRGAPRSRSHSGANRAVRARSSGVVFLSLEAPSATPPASDFSQGGASAAAARRAGKCSLGRARPAMTRLAGQSALSSLAPAPHGIPVTTGSRRRPGSVWPPGPAAPAVGS